MKTTKGKTRPAEPRGSRVIRIYGLDSRKMFAQFEAKSLKDALTEYYERNWEAKGWDHKIVGNTLQVFKGENVRNYRALELYQTP